MNILLISQCNKKALVETRRVLDQFAERRGERAWQNSNHTPRFADSPQDVEKVSAEKYRRGLPQDRREES